MTEQEIVNILKENKTKGIAYLFLPEDVWNWINDNYNNPKLLYLAPNGKWESFFETDFDDCDNVVFALPDMYELPVAKVVGGWVEFEIKDYFFEFIDENKDAFCYDWFLWHDFLSAHRRDGFTTFGGWQYEGCNTWFMTPRLNVESPNGTIYQDSFNVDNYAECECKPAIPNKIRFWREIK